MGLMGLNKIASKPKILDYMNPKFQSILVGRLVYCIRRNLCIRLKF